MGKKLNVLIMMPIPEIALERLGKISEIHFCQHGNPCPKDVLIEIIPEVDAVIADGATLFDSEIIEEAQRLKIIARYGVGYDNVNIEAANKKGIYVTITLGVLSDAVAELTMGLLLSLSRKICKAYEYVKTGTWNTDPNPFTYGTDLRGKRLGIVGLGNIGCEVARRANAFKMNILYYDEIINLDAEKNYNAIYTAFNELLMKSDFISLHVPLTPKTEKLIGDSELVLMKPTAYLINTSRGKVIDQLALIKALKSNRIAGAALDVYEIEPIPQNNPLLTLDNVILTPHIGSDTLETRTKMANAAVDEVIRVLNNKKPVNLVD